MKGSVKNERRMTMFRLSAETIAALESEVVRTGKTRTTVVEDAVLCRRLFPDARVEEAFERYQREKKLHVRDALTACVRKALAVPVE